MRDRCFIAVKKKKIILKASQRCKSILPHHLKMSLCHKNEIFFLLTRKCNHNILRAHKLKSL